MKQKIRCVVFGVGRLGYWYVENLVICIKGVELVIVVVLRKESVERVVCELGVEKWIINFKEVFEDLIIDVVVIVIFIKMYVDLIIQVVWSKKYIFVDKLLIEILDEVEIVIKEI